MPSSTHPKDHHPTGYLSLAIIAIRDLGFPIFVAMYLLWRLDAQLASLVRAENRSHQKLIELANDLHRRVTEDIHHTRPDTRQTAGASGRDPG